MGHELSHVVGGRPPRAVHFHVELAVGGSSLREAKRSGGGGPPVGGGGGGHTRRVCGRPLHHASHGPPPPCFARSEDKRGYAAALVPVSQRSRLLATKASSLSSG